jgi:hypothetical protein
MRPDVQKHGVTGQLNVLSAGMISTARKSIKSYAMIATSKESLKRNKTMKTRPKFKPVTQTDVDHVIDNCIAMAIEWEVRRDSQPYESIGYWYFHDKAIRWHNIAESLMPSRKLVCVG